MEVVVWRGVGCWFFFLALSLSLSTPSPSPPSSPSGAHYTPVVNGPDRW